MEPRTKKTTIESNARTEKAVINIKAQINEVLADRILQQTSFKLRRAPHNILLKLEIVKTIREFYHHTYHVSMMVISNALNSLAASALAAHL